MSKMVCATCHATTTCFNCRDTERGQSKGAAAARDDSLKAVEAAHPGFANRSPSEIEAIATVLDSTPDDEAIAVAIVATFEWAGDLQAVRECMAERPDGHTSVQVRRALEGVRALRASANALRAAGQPTVSAEDHEAQRRDRFAYGNVGIGNPAVTREVVDRAATSLSTPRVFEVDESEALERMREALEKMVEFDAAYLAAHPETPLLYEAGVRCIPSHSEALPDIAHVRQAGAADIDALVCWRVAELRRQGIAAKAVLVRIPRQSGGAIYTVRVQWPDGTTENVQRLLGGT